MLQYVHTMWNNLFAIHSPLVWLAFFAFVGAILAFDLGVLNKKDHVPTVRQAILYSLFYVGLSCGVGVVTWLTMGSASGMQFFSGFLIEKSMSVDNLMMFIAIFAYFQVPKEYHHRVLFWGVLGAIVMRFLAISAGVVVVSAFHPFLLVFAALLLFAAYKIFFMEDDDEEYEENAVVKWVAKHFRMTEKLDGHKFSTKVSKDGKWLRYATPLLLVLVAIETTDLMFATDSIPAIFAVSSDVFILFASNICAILGLRALFFVVEPLLEKLCYLKKALGVVLAFVGFKMVLESVHSIFNYFHWTTLSTWTSLQISTGVSLMVIGGIIGVATTASLIFPAKKEEEEEQKDAQPVKALKEIRRTKGDVGQAEGSGFDAAALLPVLPRNLPATAGSSFLPLKLAPPKLVYAWRTTMNKVKLRHLSFCIAHGMIGFPACLIASVVGGLFLVALPIAKVSGLHEWAEAIFATAVFGAWIFLLSWKLLMPYMEWMEPKLWPSYAKKNTRWI